MRNYAKSILSFIIVLLLATKAYTLTCNDLDGAYVYSQESTPVYLGFLGSQFAGDSINNTFGTYGSQFSASSVRNTLGTYGSSFGLYSANNSTTYFAPRIYKHGLLIAYLTTNTNISEGYSLSTLDSSCTFYAVSPARDPIIPDQPTNLQASDGTYLDKIELTWNSVPGATSYRVYSALSESGTPSLLGSVTGNAANVTGVTPNTIYYYWVSAVNLAGESGLSAPDSGYISSETLYSFTVDISSPVTTGSGRVESGDGNINCGTACSANYPVNSTVTLTAYPDPGSTFFMWSSPHCTDGLYSNPCTLTITQNMSTMAAFDLMGDLDANGSIELIDIILGLQVLTGQQPDSINGWGTLEGRDALGLPEVLYNLKILGESP